MHLERESEPVKKPNAHEIRKSLLTLALLMLVGMGFTLMSATAFAVTGG
ncbi:MAG: hypothetical protein PVI28_20055 [Gammaproteobacteria bacterium]|jgi:hypothetical protein